MKILKIIGWSILVMISIPLIAAQFVPKQYTVSVSEIIQSPRKDVYEYMRILENQKDYSIWVMADPDLKPEIIGTDGTKGAIQRWNSKLDEVGEGEQEITYLDINRMDVDLRFIRPFKGRAKASNIFNPISENETSVTSVFYSDNTYPMNLPSYVFGRKMIREAQQQNLRNVKAIIEKTKSN